MSNLNQEVIETFKNFTGLSEAIAIQKLEEHHGNLADAVNAFFNEGDRHMSNMLGSGASFVRDAAIITHQNELREVPIEFKGGNKQSGHSFEDAAAGTADHGPESHDIVPMDEDNDKNVNASPVARAANKNPESSQPVAPRIDYPDNRNNIEEEMIRAAIEASKQDAWPINEDPRASMPQPGQSVMEYAQFLRSISLLLNDPEFSTAVASSLEDPEISLSVSLSMEDPELYHALSFSHETAERERATRKLGGRVEIPEPEDPRLNLESSSVKDDVVKDTEDQSPVRDRTENISPVSVDVVKGFEQASVNQHPISQHHLTPQVTRSMLHSSQDDEDLASLPADRGKEMTAKEEAHTTHEKQRQQEESHRKLEEQETERQIAAKEASLSKEPSPDDNDTITLLVWMPDGSLMSRQFLKSDKLQFLFDFIVFSGKVQPGQFKLVRQYPRQVFSDKESLSTLNELGFTGKNEVLHLEMINTPVVVADCS